jgi:hypothetical protein
MDVIGWDWSDNAAGALPERRGTPLRPELREKRTLEQACLGIFLA